MVFTEVITEQTEAKKEVKKVLPDVQGEHVILDLKQVKERFSPIRTILSEQERSSIARFILLDFTEDRVTVDVNSIDSRYKSFIHIQNTEHKFTGKFIVEFDILNSILDVVENFLIIKKVDDELIIEVLQGEVPLQVYNFNFDLYTRLNNLPSRSSYTLEGEALTRYISNISLANTSMSLASLPEHKKLRGDSTGLYAQFGSTILHIPNSLFTLNYKASDLKFLSLFFKSVNVVKIVILEDKENTYFVINDNSIIFSFKKINTNDLEFVQNKFSSLSLNALAELQVPDTIKKVSLIGNLTGFHAKCDLVDDTKTLCIKSTTDTGKLIHFDLLASNSITETSFSFPISYFSNILNLFKESSLKLEVSEDKKTLMFSNENIKLIFATN